MAMKYNITVPNKTIVCGHWHCSYGNFMYGNAENEVSDFEPFKSDGILAIDACTALSGNCGIQFDNFVPSFHKKLSDEFSSVFLAVHRVKRFFQ